MSGYFDSSCACAAADAHSIATRRTARIEAGLGIMVLLRPIEAGAPATAQSSFRRVHEQTDEAGDTLVMSRARPVRHDPGGELIPGQARRKFLRLEVGGNQHEGVVARRLVRGRARSGIVAHAL